MNTTLGRLLGIALLLLCVSPSTVAAKPPLLDGDITGIELAPQSLAGAAVFIFDFQGSVDGRNRRGWGFIAAKHADLPVVEGESSRIEDGFGAIFIGFQWYRVDVNLGILTLVDDHDTPDFDDDFHIILPADIRGLFRGRREHVIEGVLSHVPFPPTIVGELSPPSGDSLRVRPNTIVTIQEPEPGVLRFMTEAAVIDGQIEIVNQTDLTVTVKVECGASTSTFRLNSRERLFVSSGDVPFCRVTITPS